MKLFVCCLFLCAFGTISQAISQDLPEVAAAKAAHFEAVRRAELIIANAPPVSHNPKQAVVETTQHKLGLNVHDTPEVAAAKAAHYEALRDAEYATSVANATGKVPDSKPIGAISVPFAQQSAPVRYPAAVHYSAPAVHHYNSAPVVPTTQHQLGVNVHDTPEVAAAKAIHNEAVRRAQQTSAAVYNDHSNTHYSAPAVHHYKSAPVVETNQHQLGVSVHDTPEVAAAKAAHFEALRRAEMTAGPHDDKYAPMAHQVMYMSVPYHQKVDYNRMVPQTNQHKLGVNVHDTPEVADAKNAHFEAFRQAQLVAANKPEYPANDNSHNPNSQYGQVY